MRGDVENKTDINPRLSYCVFFFSNYNNKEAIYANCKTYLTRENYAYILREQCKRYSNIQIVTDYSPLMNQNTSHTIYIILQIVQNFLRFEQKITIIFNFEAKS